VFVGGTGRSGTTVTARLIGAHPGYHMIAREVRFIAAKGGLCDLVQGKTTIRRFESRVLGSWFDPAPGQGLQALFDRPTIEAALARLRADVREEPWRAAADFSHRLLDPIAESAGAAGWVEMTPPNVFAAPALLRMFPDMRLVHCLRDGRDVACSVAPLFWGPDDLDEALDWWASRMERGFAACDAIPTDRVLVVQLEHLAITAREREYDRLRGFLDLEDDPAMRAFLEERMRPESAHVGRWRVDVPPDRLDAFEDHYWALVDQVVSHDRPYDPGIRLPEARHAAMDETVARGSGAA
jgi:hypothetical protein